MKKLILLVILTISLISAGCANDQQLEINSGEVESVSYNNETVLEKTDNIQEANQQATETITEEKNENNNTSENSKDQSNTDNLGEKDWEAAVFIETININPVLTVNDEKVTAAIEKGFESPATQIDLYNYTPKNTDVINFSSQNSSSELRESLTHQGFDNLEVIYDRTQYDWNDFFGDLDVSEYKRNITVNLKGESIFEADIVDEHEKYYRYFDEKKGLYYEVIDIMLGNYLDENAELTNARTGNCCNYNAIDGLVAPTYNPLVLQNGEEEVSYFITVLDNKPCVYIETLFNDKFHKKWVDIEYGLIIKELVFDSEGLLIDKKIATSITKKAIDDSIFQEPKDVEFKDITIFIFSLEGGDLETIVNAVDNTIPTSDTGILLTADTGSKVTIYTTGMDDMNLGDAIYYSKITLDSGEVRTIREIKDDRFYTVCDELEKVEIYDNSCYERKFFNYDNVGLISVKETEDAKIYSFYDPNNCSVSGLYDVYEYVIKNGEFAEINYYRIENLAVNEPISDVITYRIALIDFDENVYDDSCMDTYTIIDRGEKSFDDGEYMPFWYE